MIIDQLPLLSGDAQTTDEFPIERGTTTYKVTLDRLLAALPKDAVPTEDSTNVVESGGVYDALQTLQAGKQDTLVSGTNIKTVGGQSLLGSGNIDVGGGLYFTGVAVSATTCDIATVSNSEITADHVVAECVFASPSAITSDVTWTTSAGSLVLNGTCTAATTANVVLVKKNN